jgi:hypothetical protein
MKIGRRTDVGQGSAAAGDRPEGSALQAENGGRIQ